MKSLKLVLLPILLIFSLTSLAQTDNSYDKITKALDDIYTLSDVEALENIVFFPEDEDEVSLSDPYKHILKCDEVNSINALMMKMKKEMVDLDFNNTINKASLSSYELEDLRDYYNQINEFLTVLKKTITFTGELCSNIGTTKVFKNQDEMWHVMELYYECEQLVYVRNETVKSIKELENSITNNSESFDCEERARYVQNFLKEIETYEAEFLDREYKAKDKYLSLSTKQQNLSVSTLSDEGTSIFEKFKSSLLKERGMFEVVVEGNNGSGFNTSKLENLLQTKLNCDKTSSNTQITSTNKVEKTDGCIDGDCVNGYGTYIYADGEQYAGYFKNSLRNGEGYLLLNEGTIYKGVFKNDELISGEKKIGNGTLEKGDFVNGKLNGYCMKIYPNGDKFEGEFSNGILNGYGMRTNSNGDQHVGSFENGRLNGYGEVYNKNGDLVFSGDFKDGKIVEKTNGCIEGDCDNGYGTYVYTNGKYIGYFKNSLHDGEGSVYYTNGVNFTGTFERGRRYKGKLYKNNDLIYNGTFEDDGISFSHGIRYYNDNGYRYEGPFKNDEPHGYGKLYKYDDLVYSGKFINGEPVGKMEKNDTFYGYKIIPKDQVKKGRNLLSPTVQKQLKGN